MINIKFVEPSQAKGILSVNDEYLQKIDKFNLNIFNHKNIESMKNAFGYCAVDFNDVDKKNLNKYLDSFNHKLQELYPHNTSFLDVLLIKSNGRECGLPYTRHNFIVLTEMCVNSSHIIFHESFHVVSRQNPEFQKYLYEQIGFKNYGYDVLDKNNIKYILNPDAPNNNFYVEIEDLKVTPYAKSIDLRKLSFLILDAKDKVINDLKVHSQIKNKYYEKYAPLEYLLHPEEILAEAWSSFWHNKLDLSYPYYTVRLSSDHHLFKVIQDGLEKYSIAK